MASMPPHSTSTPSDDPIRSSALRFWRNFASDNEAECKAALSILGELRGDNFGDMYESLSSPDSSGMFVKVDLPATSPKAAQDAWNVDKTTKLVRIDPQQHCLAVDGSLDKHDGGDYFVACASLKSSSLLPGACTIGTHEKKDRPRAELTGPAYLVKVRASSLATKPKVLAGVMLLEDKLPRFMIECGLGDSLQEFEAFPRVWKMVLENYPGLTQMLKYADLTPSTNDSVDQGVKEEATRDVPEVKQASSVASSKSGVSQLSGEEQSINQDLDEKMISAFGLKAIQLRPFSTYRSQSYQAHETMTEGSGGSWSLPGAARASRSEPGWAGYDDWRDPLKRVETTILRNLAKTERVQDIAIDRALSDTRAYTKFYIDKVQDTAEEAAVEAARAHSRIDTLDRKLVISRHKSTQGPNLSIETDHDSSTPPPRNGWNDLSSQERDALAEMVLQHIKWTGQAADKLVNVLLSNLDMTELAMAVKDQLDIGELAKQVDASVGLTRVRESIQSQGERLSRVEREFSSEQGVIQQLRSNISTLEASRNTTSCERAGYVFAGLEDVQAFIQLAGTGKLATLCLDLPGLLTLAQDPYVTYEAGIKVHADAIKANFSSVLESRIKMSFEIPYPELIVRCVDNTSTVANGGAKWAPMFLSPELFEDDFRDGAHRRVLKGIEKAYELTRKAIDAAYPIGFRGIRSDDNRKIHAILTAQLQLAYHQTVGYIECLLPFYRTLKGGSLSSEESWSRVFVFNLEFLTSIQEQRVTTSDVSNEAAMIWGCFKATELAEEFRKQKFIEHPKALSILALTSIEREGKTMALLEDRMEKKIAEASKGGDRVTKLDTRIQTLENKVKNILAKNPELK